MSEETRGAPTCPECGHKMLDDRDGMYGGWFCARNHPTVIQVVGSEDGGAPVRPGEVHGRGGGASLPDDFEVHVGDALEGLQKLPDESVQTCVTSPPYWGLRDYGVEGQLGMEETPEAYVENLVAVFREVRRVLRDDGTLWLNLGDSYVGGNYTDIGGNENFGSSAGVTDASHGSKSAWTELPPKNLVGIPWRVAFALQRDGWWLRSDIIWAKGISFLEEYAGSVMPESVTDRPTSSHEHVFLLSKNDRYFYDHEAVKERSLRVPGSPGNRTHHNGTVTKQARTHPVNSDPDRVWAKDGKRNLRNVWAVNPKPFPDAHFAVYPPGLVRPCIRAGTSEKGACAECGAPWERVVRRETATPGQNPGHNRDTGVRNDGERAGSWTDQKSETVGWEPNCDCDIDDRDPCLVLDPFAGAGTTGVVCTELGRRFLGIELNPEYAEMAKRRIMDTNLTIL